MHFPMLYLRPTSINIHDCTIVQKTGSLKVVNIYKKSQSVTIYLKYGLKAKLDKYKTFIKNCIKCGRL